MTYNPKLRGPVLKMGAVSSETALKVNNSGATINKAEPVRLDASDTLQRINPSIESQVLSVIGLAKNSVPNSSSTQVVISGRLEDITTSAAVGDLLYISKTGGITPTKPSLGVGGFVEGDFAVQVGVVVRNETNPALKDVLINLKLIGQL